MNFTGQSDRQGGAFRWTHPASCVAPCRSLNLFKLIAGVLIALFMAEAAGAAPPCDRIVYRIKAPLETALRSWRGDSGPLVDHVEIGGGFAAELRIGKSGVFFIPKKRAAGKATEWSVDFRPPYGGTDTIFFDAYGFQDQGGTGFIGLSWDLEGRIGTVASLTYYNDTLGPMGVNLSLTCRLALDNKRDLRELAGLTIALASEELKIKR